MEHEIRNTSNNPHRITRKQITAELGLSKNDVQQMSMQLRSGIVAKKEVTLSDEVEFDELYVVAGHKGHPTAVAAKKRKVAAIISKELEVEAPLKRKSRPF